MSEKQEVLLTPAKAELTIPSYYDLPRRENLPEFDAFRKVTLQRMKKDIIERISTRPQPDDEELSAAVYRELIEPQCREAIFVMRRKGYDTYSSGFGIGNAQVVDGILPLTQAVVDLLVQRGYVVYTVGGPCIMFQTEHPNPEEIKERWDRLAQLLPDLGSPAPSQSASLKDFYTYVKKECREKGVLVQEQGGSLVVRTSK